ncbi:MAG: hypothetical protein M1830_005009 [Pleopsidium flavum]|nr:MAG: hypothetical protein M1830_005064 [Pleopsidium flavum]KAI9869870.1 MAG: hypothetical protein M1830_005009 [Pleopsidium flavum]
MSSATGIPTQNPAASGRGEDEPLLGRAGDASQQEGKGIQFNLFIGTAIIAQAGIWILLNSAGILLTTESILILQPTHTPTQKRQGTVVHSVLNVTSVLSLIAGLVIIEYNKISHGGTHFDSPHSILGLITYIIFITQALIGIAQYYTPGLFGSAQNAKAMYKYHRASGYALLILSFVTVAAATQTDFNKNVLHIKLWAVIVAAVLTLMGVLPRIKKQKLGFS